MKIGYRGDKGEAEAASGSGPAALQSVKPFENPLTLMRGYTWSIVGHAADWSRRGVGERHLDMGTLRCMPARVLDEVRQHLCEQFAVAGNAELRLNVGDQSFAFGFDCSTKVVGDCLEQSAQINLTEGRAASASFYL
jgi:hypothetical protein